MAREVESTHLHPGSDGVRQNRARQPAAATYVAFQSSGVCPRRRTKLRRTSIDSDLKKQRRRLSLLPVSPVLLTNSRVATVVPSSGFGDARQQQDLA
nr:hypothetical protein Iba_chr12aCG13750 [Ipomoea batatas]